VQQRNYTAVNPLCHLHCLPRPIRLVLAWALIAMGGSLFLTPLPGGIVLIAGGGLILHCTVPSLRGRIASLLKYYPRLSARIVPLLSACERCTKSGPAPSCTPSLRIAGDKGGD